MKRFIRAVLPLALLSVAVLASAQTVDSVRGEVLVKFRSTVNPGRLENRAIGATIRNTISRINVQRVSLPAGMDVVDGLNYYRSQASVVYAEPNNKKVQTFTPNDSQFNAQYGPKKMQCPEAWDITKGSATVIVAVLDTGIDLNHEDLKNKLVPGFDFSDNDSDPTAAGDHGVHCAGIIGAETNNAKGVAGVGFNVKIMPLKIFPNATDAVSAQAIIHAADNGAKVISMSYGAYGESNTERDAVNYAWGKGVVLVGGVGNDNVNNKFYPAAYPNVIAVGSTGTSDVKSGFSNFGPDWVDCAAPGENILSTVVGGYANLSGTSMATPMVAGVVALVRSIAPANTTATAIRNAVESTTDPVPGNFFKFGRVNAFKAVKLFDIASVTVSPVTGIEAWMGTGETGALSDIQASDNNYFTVNTQSDVLGQVAGVNVSFALNGPASGLRSAQLVFEANGGKGATNQVFLWNFATNKYDLVRATALTISGANRQKVNLPLNLTNYVSGGSITVGLRAIGPKKAPRTPVEPFTFKVNFAQIETRPL